MALPEPQLGLVISYAYLWHHEYRRGREEGGKHRPCVIVLAIERAGDDGTLVRVVPVTHRPPDDPSAAIELPVAVKRHLGLDAERSWIILDEINEFIWPGFDLRPVTHGRDRFEYGFLPPRLFELLMAKMRQVWQAERGRTVPRD